MDGSLCAVDKKLIIVTILLRTLRFLGFQVHV